MKRLLFSIVISTHLLAAKAQKVDSLKGLAADTSIFVKVEHPPEYPGGISEFLKYVMKSIQYPAEVRSGNQRGKVIVHFITEKAGEISNIEITKNIAPALDKEVIKVLRSSPKWLPGKQNGVLVRVRYTIPLIVAMSNKVYIFFIE